MNGQEEAIKKISGPCVVLAGAGTGKTYTIVEKIKYLIKERIYEPRRIVCITFSNEAANNLLSRVRRALESEENGEPIIRTFHGFSADLLRMWGDKIDINKEFGILDPDEAKVVLHNNLNIPAGNCARYISAIGNAKDIGVSIESLEKYLLNKMKEFEGIDLEKRAENLQFEMQTIYLRNDKRQKSFLMSEIRKIRKIIDLRKFISAWKGYEKIKKLKNFQDYSDLNQNALLLLQKNPEIAENYDYVIIDEFQDTNKIQLDMLFFLSPNGNITVVGDMNQSIYRFRGAYRENYNEFKKHFFVSDKEIFALDKSYRSSNKILNLAHKLILNNYSKKEECFKVESADGREGKEIEVFELKNGKEEARKAVELIEKEVKEEREMESICVMFRTHQQGRIIKRVLEERGIPFCSVSKNSLLKQKSIKTVIDYLTILGKLASKEKGGEQAWWDLFYQLNFAEVDLIKIGRFIKDNKEDKNISVTLFNELVNLGLSDSGRLAAKILIERIKRLIPFVNIQVHDLLLEVYRISGLINGNKTQEEKEVMLNLNKFYELCKEHAVLHESDLKSFLYYLSVIEKLGISIDAAELEQKGVRLMTLHATKGLEYETVIITNMAQKRFPIERFDTNSLIPLELSPEFIGKNLSESDVDYFLYQYEREHQLSEERRLCYVAFTRAKENLILTYAQEYGGRKFYPSQFLYESAYESNPDVNFVVDNEEKYFEKVQEADREIEFESILKSENFEPILIESARRSELEKDIKKELQEEKVFSPSSLILFAECQKKYEYKYVYHMPEEKTISWEAMRLGSFVHIVLEKGVKEGFASAKEFIDYAKELHSESEWESVELEEALHLIRVFFERHKNKYKKDSKTEIKLNSEISGIKFIGFADRIDFNSDGIEIVDYKTGRSNVPVKSRNWQLGYYVLAARWLGKVRRITLDMLRHDKPLEFEIDDKGNAFSVNSDRIESFNVYDVEQELIMTAHEILDAYKNGFKPCSIEKNCEFCSEWVYGG